MAFYIFFSFLMKIVLKILSNGKFFIFLQKNNICVYGNNNIEQFCL